MLYWSLCEETVCFEASVSETLWFSMSFQRKCLETKRITSVTVIYWTLRPGCRRTWNSSFVSLGYLFTLLSPVVESYATFRCLRPNAPGFRRMWAAESDAEDCITPCATMAHPACIVMVIYLHQLHGTAQNMPCLPPPWKCQLLFRNK